MTHVRWYITAPHGQFYGRHPDTVRTGGEHPYIAELGRQVRGSCEVVLPLGRADVACDERVFEVEPVERWRNGARQVMAYAAQTGLKPCLALFGQANYLRIYLFLRDRMPMCPIELWVWRGAWVQTTSRREAVRKYAPLITDPPRVIPAQRGPAGARVSSEPVLPWDEWPRERSARGLYLNGRAERARRAAGEFAAP